MSCYYDVLTQVMTALGTRADSVFLGQSIRDGGTGLTASFAHVARDKLIELPVFENTQLGMAIGLALAGKLPICVYPRWNFLLEATSQLIQHLDLIPLYSQGRYRPRVIIRVAVPTADPLDPGPQHLGDFSEPFRAMLKTVRIVNLGTACDIAPAYQRAADSDHSTILVEHARLYDCED